MTTWQQEIKDSFSKNVRSVDCSYQDDFWDTPDIYFTRSTSKELADLFVDLLRRTENADENNKVKILIFCFSCSRNPLCFDENGAEDVIDLLYNIYFKSNDDSNNNKVKSVAHAIMATLLNPKIVPRELETNRFKIIKYLGEEPYKLHEIFEDLKLDFTKDKESVLKERLLEESVRKKLIPELIKIDWGNVYDRILALSYSIKYFSGDEACNILTNIFDTLKGLKKIKVEESYKNIIDVDMIEESTPLNDLHDLLKLICKPSQGEG